MHPTIIHAIQNRRDFEAPLNGGLLFGRASEIILHGGAILHRYEVTYSGQRIFRTDAYGNLEQYRYKIDDETFYSDAMYNRATRVNAVSDAIAAAIGL